MRNPKRRGSDTNGNGNTVHRDDRFSLGSFVRDVVSGAVMGGLASVAFYGAGKAVEVLKQSLEQKRIQRIENYVVNAANERAPYSKNIF